MRASFRSLYRSPLFALTNVGLLALAVAMLLALASTGWALLLKPLPFPNGERLVEVRGWSSKMNFSLDFSPAFAVDLRQMAQVERVGIYRTPNNLERVRGTPLREVALDQTSFELLAATPVLGRLPDASASDEIAIAYDLWVNEFGSDPRTIGRRWELAAGSMRIVGVMPDGFSFPQQSVRVWRGLTVDPALMDPANLARWGGERSLVLLKRGQSVPSLQAAIDARLRDEPAVASMREHMGLVVQAEPLRAVWIGDRGSLLSLLIAAATLALFALLANLGSLWLGRCISRRSEVGVRQVLGAQGWRAAAPVYAEILILTTIGVLGGLLLTPLALAGLRVLGVIPPDAPLLPGVDGATLLLAVLSIVGLSGLLSLVPWWSLKTSKAAERTLHASLSSGSRALGQTASLGRWRQGLLVTQLAMAVTLLGASLLLLRSLLTLLHVDTGFQARDLVLLDVIPVNHPGATVPEVPGERMQALIGELRQLPQVRELSYASAPPLAGTEAVRIYYPGPEAQPEGARMRRVGPGYFRLLGQPLLAGRAFAPEDDPAATIIVDRLFADRYLGGIAAVGQSMNLADPGEPAQMARVIAVVSTVKHGALDEVQPLGSVYHYAADASAGGMLAHFLLLRADGRELALRQRIEVLAATHGLRLRQYAPISRWIAESTKDRWPLLQLFGGFALTCLLLCCSGLAAQLHFLIQARRAELGLRAALGASAKRLLSGILKEQLAVLVVGLALGLSGAALCGRLLASQLHQIGPYDPFSLCAAVGLIGLISGFSGWLTARSGIRSQPMDALRQV